MGIDDDGSYVKSAQVLAQTGHIVYNGWATAMLGWQLYLGAIFAQLFGFSFTAIRASTLLVALFTVFLMHRTMVRAGINTRNATIGTLVIALSPLFLPLAFTFMTDIGGLFCLVLCLYACLRALQARTNRAALAWLAFAAVSNAVGGTVRQIAWLGVLVMFPCTVWLLRRRPSALLTGSLLYVASGLFIFASMRWFSHQPYSVGEPLLPGQIDRQHLVHLGTRCIRASFDVAMFLLPILIAFLPALSLRNRLTSALLVLGGMLGLAGGFVLYHRHKLTTVLAPYIGPYVTPRGLIDGAPLKGIRPTVLMPDVRLVLTVLILLGLLGCLTFLISGERQRALPNEARESVSWQRLLILILPVSAAYIGLLLPRGAFGEIFDRYLLPLLLFCAILLLRFFQDRVRPNLPLITCVFVLIFAAYGVAGTHDAFSMYRGRIAAVAELRQAGIPDTSIDGGFEHNGVTQIERFGHINDHRIKIPADAYISEFPSFPEHCAPFMGPETRAIIPGYALSFDPMSCGGPSRFSPVTYHNWLGEHSVNLYIVNTVKGVSP